MIPTTILSKTFAAFYKSEKTAAILLLLCTAVSLSVANTASGVAYVDLWHTSIGHLRLEEWINDGLMAIFFLLIGLELERELYVGELADFRRALLPIIAAAGGVAFPALIYLAFNLESVSWSGVGIPMATDIAFALGVLALLGSRIPASLKIFLAALAVIDDLIAVVVIAVFYTRDLALTYLLGALIVFGVLVVLNKLRVMLLLPYIVGGVLMWFLMLKSGVHATIAGVLLAFAIPFTGIAEDQESPSHKLEHLIHRPVAFGILPIFALANTAVILESGALSGLLETNSLGIASGLLFGKPLGITLASFVAVFIGLCALPTDLSWKHIFGVGILGGIGFTMSIFITNLAFLGDTDMINSSKLAILVASLIAGTIGFLWLRLFTSVQPNDATNSDVVAASQQ